MKIIATDRNIKERTEKAKVKIKKMSEIGIFLGKRAPT